MPRHSGLRKRALVTAGVLIGSIVLLQTAGRGERVSPRRPLRDLPAALGAWQGTDQPLEQRVVDAAGVDEYINRVYRDGNGNRVALYIGYYASQRTGDTIHSPKNCIPGSGWEPVRADWLAIAIPGAEPTVVNDYLIQKGRERELVLYWYQARGRVVASEYWAKFWMVHDAITRNRTDGALVRVVTGTPGGEAEARARAVEFVQALYPRLKDFVPN